MIQAQQSTDDLRCERRRSGCRQAGDRKTEAQRLRGVRVLDALDNAVQTTLFASAAGRECRHRSSRALLLAPVLGRDRQAGQTGRYRMMLHVHSTRATAASAMYSLCV